MDNFCFIIDKGFIFPFKKKDAEYESYSIDGETHCEIGERPKDRFRMLVKYIIQKYNREDIKDLSGIGIDLVYNDIQPEELKGFMEFFTPCCRLNVCSVESLLPFILMKTGSIARGIKKYVKFRDTIWQAEFKQNIKVEKISHIYNGEMVEVTLGQVSGIISLPSLMDSIVEKTPDILLHLALCIGIEDCDKYLKEFVKGLKEFLGAEKPKLNVSIYITLVTFGSTSEAFLKHNYINELKTSSKYKIEILKGGQDFEKAMELVIEKIINYQGRIFRNDFSNWGFLFTDHNFSAYPPHHFTKLNEQIKTEGIKLNVIGAGERYPLKPISEALNTGSKCLKIVNISKFFEWLIPRLELAVSSSGTAVPSVIQNLMKQWDN